MSAYLDLLLAARKWAEAERAKPELSPLLLENLKTAARAVDEGGEASAKLQALAALPNRLEAPKVGAYPPELCFGWISPVYSFDVHPRFEEQDPRMVRLALRATAARRELAMRKHIVEGKPDVGDEDDGEPVEPWPLPGWPRPKAGTCEHCEAYPKGTRHRWPGMRVCIACGALREDR